MLQFVASIGDTSAALLDMSSCQIAIHVHMYLVEEITYSITASPSHHAMRAISC